jgi:hypothetical protein
MMKTRKNKIILGLALIFLLGIVGPVSGQATKTFTGKITEIAKGTELDLNKMASFYTLRLEEHPKIQFHLSPDDAVRFGVVDATGTSGVLTPKKSKGLGWKVKIDCDANKTGPIDAPSYKVISLTRLDN